MNDLWDASPCYMYGSEAISSVRQMPSQSPTFPIVVQSKSSVKVNGPGLGPRMDE